MAAMLARRPEVDEGRVCVRGSSMGGLLAIHAAAGDGSIAGVIAICPAGEHHLLAGLRAGTLEMRAGERARGELRAWLEDADLREAVGRIAGRPLILVHAEGDERIPSGWSRELYERAGEPRRLIVVPGGTHRSAQHDPELQAASLRWIARSLGPAPGAYR